MILLFGVHNHQPVGNEENLLEEAFMRSYKPLIDVFCEYEDLKLNLHFSGWLLEWIELKHPDFFDKLRDLIRRGRVEILSGGFYEPILPILRTDEAILQIRKLNNFIDEKFGISPKGLWLAERVWEQNIVKVLKSCGIEYVPMDDHHFLLGGCEREKLYSYYLTEYEGELLKVIPISRDLRYMIPFSKPEEVLDRIRKIDEAHDDPMLLFFDDGEKFGVWPGTFDLVYEEGWLHRFFELISKNSDWIRSMTISEYLTNHEPVGKIYIPTASYPEMMEWSKLTDESIGCWRNFLIKYEESNLMYGRMMCVGERLKKIGYDNLPKELIDTYLMSQVNDPYWHGVFGGVYSPNLRQSVSSSLSKVENCLDDIDEIKEQVIYDERDQDLDGFLEKILKNGELLIVLDPDYGGRIIGMEVRKKNYELSNTLRRRLEKYHAELKIDLPIDWYGKYSLIDHFFKPDMDLNSFIKCNYPEQGDFVNQPFDSRFERNEIVLERHGNIWVDDSFEPVFVKKVVMLDRTNLCINHTIENESERPIEFFHGLEFNLSFLSDGYGRYLFLGERKVGLSNILHEIGVSKFEITAQIEGVSVEFNTSQPVEILIFPIKTFSKTEKGIEEVYQETTVLITRRFSLEPGKWIELDLKLKFRVL